jgi:hypothetical protein
LRETAIDQISQGLNRDPYRAEIVDRGLQRSLMDSCVGKAIAHVHAGEPDRVGAKLHGKIKRVKPGMAAAIARSAADHASLFPQNLFSGLELDRPQAVNLGGRRRGCNLHPAEIRDAVIVDPPSSIAAVKDIGPRTKLPRTLDSDDLGLPPKCVKRSNGCAWPSRHDDGLLPPPIRPLTL